MKAANKENAPTAATVGASDTKPKQTYFRKDSGMNHNATVLVFQQHHLDITDIHGEPWLRGLQVASALGYQNPRADIANLYNRNADEFDETMTQVISLPDLRLQSASAGAEEGQMRETRIFSLRGCHLLGMLAKIRLTVRRARPMMRPLLNLTAESFAPTARFFCARRKPSRQSFFGGTIAVNTIPKGNSGSRLLAVVESCPLIPGQSQTKLTGVQS